MQSMYVGLSFVPPWVVAGNIPQWVREMPAELGEKELTAAGMTAAKVPQHNPLSTSPNFSDVRGPVIVVTPL